MSEHHRRLAVSCLACLTLGFYHTASAQSPWTDKLFADAGWGNLAAVQEDLARGADVNARDSKGRTPLHSAASDGNDDIALVLLTHGADVNARGKDGETPLHEAAEFGYAKVATTLLAHGADVNAKDSREYAPLLWAAENGYFDVATVLLAHGADANASDNFGDTPLHEAALHGFDQISVVLLAHDAHVDAKNRVGYTPEMEAAGNGHAELAKLLHDAGPDFWVLLSTGDSILQAGTARNALAEYVLALQHFSDGGRLEVDVEKPVLEKIIKVVLQLNPPPAIPQDAIQHAAYAEAAVEVGKKDGNPAHLNDAVSELQKALLIAPWWAQGYFNLGAALQKANRPGEAASALQLYLLADPNAAKAQDVQMEIYKLQYDAKQQ